MYIACVPAVDGRFRIFNVISAFRSKELFGVADNGRLFCMPFVMEGFALSMSRDKELLKLELNSDELTFTAGFDCLVSTLMPSSINRLGMI